MRVEVVLPRVSETIDEVVVNEWLVEVGAEVDADTEILSVDADKSTAEIPATVKGVLVEQLVEPGDEISTGTVVAVIEQP